MSILIRITFLAGLLFAVQHSYSQCPGQGQNPATAFPVCGTTTFSQSNVPSCTGRPIPGPCGAGLNDVNPFWYKFTCYTAGTLGFVITPNSAADDYDWQVFDITNRDPNDVYTDPSLFVACNWSAALGSTGATPTGTGLANCAGGYPINSEMPNLIAGHEYLLMVSNWSNSQQGYSLTFSGGTAVITDPLPPDVSSATANCDGTQITVRFNKGMKCNSLAANGSDFVINPGGTIVSASSVNCTAGFDFDSAVVTLSAPLAPGNYIIEIANGSDGNSVLDNCSTPIPAGNGVPFTITAQSPLAMGAVDPPACLPTSLTINFAEPVKCNTIAANGSDFSITGPSAVSVTGATPVNCNANGEATAITIQLAGPILTSGSYQVVMNTGSDGNTVLGSCSRSVTPGSAAPFTLDAQAPIPMGTIQQPPCIPTSITIDFADAILCSSIAVNGSDFSITGPSTVNITGATPVNCDANGETTSITIQFAGPILTTGNYQVVMNNGSDGNTLLGSCGRTVTPGSATPFNLAAQAPIPMGTIQQPSCTPASIIVDFADAILCSSIAANGSDFTLTGPSSMTIIGAVPVGCNANGETNSIRIDFAGPLLTTGSYTLNVATGTDGNTLVSNQCGRSVDPASSAGFTLTPQAPIPLGTIGALTCAPSSITITFADSIICSSIAANGSDFAIAGPTSVTVQSATGTCSANGRTVSITLNLSSPINLDGNYTVTVNQGSDGNSLIGNCNREVIIGSSTPFTIPAAPAPTIISTDVASCEPGSIRINLDHPVRCSSIAANGSDFAITGPSGVTIASATGVCDPATGLATAIDIQLSSPIQTGGNYDLQLTTGSDGNTLLSECYRESHPVVRPFVVADTVSAIFDQVVTMGCETNDVEFSHDGANGVNQWTWTVNGNAAGTAQSFTMNFSASSSNQVELTVSNGECTDTYSTTIVFDNLVEIDFEIPESVCPEDSAYIINNTTGLVDTWQWTFGNGNTSDLQHPTAQVYPTTGVEQLYNISLTASNAAGCSITETKTITVLSSCIIAVPTAFTPNGDGLNDFLYPLNAIKADNLDFKVFNRWGQLVFHSRDWTRKWDGRIEGKMQSTGVFVWTLNYTDRDTGQRFSLKGTTLLIN